MGQWMNGYMERLDKLAQKTAEAGGKERVAAQHAQNKLTAAERLDFLCDPNSFEPMGSPVKDSYRGKTDKLPSPGDGVIMGTAKINNRRVCVFAFDFTVMDGMLGDQAAFKLADLVDTAVTLQVPLVGLFDCAGLRVGIADGAVGTDGLGRLMRNLSLASGIIPRIALVLGPCTGLLAPLPVLFDFNIMREDLGFLWLGGKHEDEDAGFGEFSMEKSGQADMLAEDDEEAITLCKDLLEFLPQNCWEHPAMGEADDDPMRREEALLDVMPDDSRQTYDIHEIIELITDKGEFFELKEDFATHLVTGFARIGGYTAGIVANNPDELSGILEPDSSDKYDRFMNILDCFNIPLITLVDTTAFPPGDRWERAGVIRHGAKLLHSYSHLTCPKVTMVLRRSYGGANIVMGASKMRPDFIFGWPTAEFAPTGPETIVHTVFHKELAKAREDGNYDEVFPALLAMLREQFTVMNLAKVWTSYYTVHEIIDPRQTREKIFRALEATRNKNEILPEKRRSIKPA